MLELTCTVGLVVGTLVVLFPNGGVVPEVVFVVAHVLVSVLIVTPVPLLGNVNDGGGGAFDGGTVGTEPVLGGTVGV